MRHVGATFVCLVVLGSAIAFAQQHTMPSATKTDEDIIKSAMSAAPEAISKGATIIDVGSDGKIQLCAKAVTNLPAWPITQTHLVQIRCVPTGMQWNGSTLG